jgi:hypothetical protein
LNTPFDCGFNFIRIKAYTMVEPFLFLAESLLAYLISLAAGLRSDAIATAAQKKLEGDIKAFGRKSQDRALSRPFMESVELVPIGVAQLKHRLNDAFLDGPITKLCADAQFQQEISGYLTANDPATRNELRAALDEKINNGFLAAGATAGQAKSNTERFFDMILRIVFADPSLSRYLFHRSVRYIIGQNERQQALLQEHGHRLEEIGNQLKGQSGSKVVPLQRPTRAEHFTGREKELKRLFNGLQPGSILTLWGPGGIGKSALAVEALWRLAPGDDPPAQFPDGIFYHDFYTTPDVETAFEQIARSFGEEPEPSAMAATQRALSRRKALLLLDGAEAAQDLHRLLCIVGACGVLITSQDKRDARGVRVDMEPLPMAKALSLLRQWCPTGIDKDLGGRICELVGCLPLAVGLAGRYMNKTGEAASDYLDWLQNSPLDALDQGQRRNQSGYPSCLAEPLPG